MKSITMKLIALLLILLPIVGHSQTRCQQVGGFTYCNNGYTVQDLVGPSNQHQYIIRERETIQPDPVKPITINPYSVQYYRGESRLIQQSPAYYDPYRY